MNVGLLQESLLISAKKYRDFRKVLMDLEPEHKTVVIFDDVPYVVQHANVADLDELIEVLEDHNEPEEIILYIYRLIQDLLDKRGEG